MFLHTKTLDPNEFDDPTGQMLHDMIWGGCDARNDGGELVVGTAGSTRPTCTRSIGRSPNS